MKNIEGLYDSEGFMMHCAVASCLLENFDLNPHTKHHIRGAVREATKKVTPISGKGKDIGSTISVGAYEKIVNGELTGLVLEHAIPVSYINELVLKIKGYSTPEKIADIVLTWTVLTVITVEEHEKLSSLKLGKSMPADWDGNSKYARYNKAGIEVLDVGYKDAVKKSRPGFTH